MKKSNQPRQHKYKAKPVTIDGIKFPSKREGKRYCELKLLQAAGMIRALELQPRFELHADTGNKVGEYIADFRYLEHTQAGWVCVVEDTKGFRTDLYKWKRRHVLAQYGIEIRET